MLTNKKMESQYKKYFRKNKIEADSKNCPICFLSKNFDNKNQEGIPFSNFLTSFSGKLKTIEYSIIKHHYIENHVAIVPYSNKRCNYHFPSVYGSVKKTRAKYFQCYDGFPSFGDGSRGKNEDKNYTRRCAGFIIDSANNEYGFFEPKIIPWEKILFLEIKLLLD